MSGKAERFIDALRRVEEGGDVEAMVPLYSEGAQLSNPTDERPHEGPEGARRFWGAYRDAFSDVHSEFRNVVETDDVAILEWRSRGRTATGDSFEYDGVSVVEYADGRIRRFRAYFDPNELRA